MMRITYGRQNIGEPEIRAASAVLSSDFITQGPKIKEFEDDLCEYAGAKYAVAVSSGTAALHIACLAAGIKKGDEVMTSAMTFVASSNCVLYCGGRPVFADIDRDTAEIDPAEIKRNLTARTRAVIPVHFAGLPCDMSKIAALAIKRGLAVIEDASHALGAVYKGAKLGSCRYSDMAAFSFHPVKSITTGEGGVVLTNDKGLYRRLISLRNHGIVKEGFTGEDRRGWHYEMQSLGYNYRMTDIQAAIGSTQLKRLDAFITKRRRIADIYKRAFRSNRYFDTPMTETKDSVSACHIYPIRLKDAYKDKRGEIFAKLRSRGIGVQVHYIPVYLHPYYQKLGYKKGICPNAEDYYERTITLPLHTMMSVEDADGVVRTLFRILEDIDKGCSRPKG